MEGNKKGRKEGRTREEKREVRYTRSRLSTWQAEGLQLREGEEKRERESSRDLFLANVNLRSECAIKAQYDFQDCVL